MLKTKLAIALTSIVAAFSVSTGKADAYLHSEPAASTCWSAVYPSAAANLRSDGGIRTYTYNWTRSTDTSMQVQIEAFSPLSFVGGDNLTYYLTDRLACRVVGNDPGTVTTISDWGTTWRNAYQLF